jgi:hypothetical protein
MAGNVTIDVVLDFRQEEPDGSICRGCGQVIYLTQIRVWARAGSRDKGTPTEMVLCESCAEVARKLE